MFIKSLSYKNHYEGWEIDNVQFTDFNLLVGASGVGKTQILRAIKEIQSIATLGKGFNGVEWELEFITNKGNSYSWEGNFETINQEEVPISSITEQNTNPTMFTIKKESLRDLQNDKDLFNRTENKILFKDKETLRLSDNESIIKILNKEDFIDDIFMSMHMIDNFKSELSLLSIFNLKMPVEDLLVNHGYGDDILNKFLSLCIPNKPKAITCSNHFPDLFSKIKERFMEIFPQVEDVRFFKNHNNAYELQIKEISSNQWIPQKHLSLGMFTTFWHICTIYLSAPGSVILIDEIENSLGFNCLPSIIEDMKDAKKQLQFIITSHHPYVINDIPVKDWKIVTRHHGKIVVRPATEFHLGESHHEPMLQLINLPQYRTGNLVAE